MRLCECGCGLPIESPDYRKTRYRAGHWAKAHSRDHWPERDELVRLLAEMGSATAVAKHLHLAPTTLGHIINGYGIEYTPHGNSMEKSTIRFGWSGEEHAALILGAAIVRNPNFREAPFDLLWDGLRVEVKTSRPGLSGKPPAGAWHFKVIHNQGKNDLFFCIACAPDGMPVRYFMIPAADVTVTMIRIPVTLRSKWMRYEWRPGQARGDTD